MSFDSHSTKQSERPSYPQPTPAKTAATALAAVLVSSLTLGGVLSLFEMRADETASAWTSVKSAPSTNGLALRKVDPAPRG